MFCFSGHNAAYPTKEDKPKDTQTVNFQPPAVSAITVDELKEITDNFGTKALIGEGSYGRVYYGVLRSGQAAALKKLDSSKQPDQEILGQVMSKAANDLSSSTVLGILSIELTSCCMSNRCQWYQDLNMKMCLSSLAIVLMEISGSLLMSMLQMVPFMIFFMVRISCKVLHSHYFSFLSLIELPSTQWRIQHDVNEVN